MEDKNPTVGRYLFDSLTKGMYDNPLCIFREYIQNATDAIDKAVASNIILRRDAEISINIDPQLKTISIEDNGFGIYNKDIKKTLLNVGDSEKTYADGERGFRGIGRLGGMAYCDELIFETKADDENLISINTWDCNKIGQMLNPHSAKYKGYSLPQVINECAKIEKRESSDEKKNYFKVIMKGVGSTNDVLMDIREIRKYLAQVAPVPFNYQDFPFGKQIDEKLRREIRNFNTFKILVNYDEIFKPYKTTVLLSKSKSDKITNIIEFDILDGDKKIIAKGWRAQRENYIGAILKSEDVQGIRVRAGNIQIGDEDTLDNTFREKRFNSYFIGEIHVIDSRLLPNSRRDNFEESTVREIFYLAIEKEIGEPLSELVREKSIAKNKTKIVEKAADCILKIKESQKKGFVTESHKKDSLIDLRNCRDTMQKLSDKNSTNEEIKDLCKKKIEVADSLITDIETNANEIIDQFSRELTNDQKEILNEVFTCIYEKYNKATNAIKLVEIITRYINKK